MAMPPAARRGGSNWLVRNCRIHTNHGEGIGVWGNSTTGGTQGARIVNNEMDSALDMRSSVIGNILAQNPKITTHSGNESPYGYLDWWPNSLWMNTQIAPYNDARVRRAISLAINRDAINEVLYEGAPIATIYPFPLYPGLQAFVAPPRRIEEEPVHRRQDASRRIECLQRPRHMPHRAVGAEEYQEVRGVAADDAVVVQVGMGQHLGGAVLLGMGPQFAPHLPADPEQQHAATQHDAARPVSLRRADGLGGQDLGHGVLECPRQLRHDVGVVLQEPFLFRGTIWQNLVYGLPTSTPEAAVAAVPFDVLYARVDLIRDNDGQLAIMELEMIEPELFFRFKPEAADLLAAGIARRLAN